MTTNTAQTGPYNEALTRALRVAGYVTKTALIFSTARTLGARLNSRGDVALAVATTAALLLGDVPESWRRKNRTP